MLAVIVRRAVLVLILFACAAASSSQTMATRQVMKDKLVHTQRVLEGIMKSDYAMLERESAALGRETEQPGWAVLTTPEYIRYSSAFLNAADDVMMAARDRDLDAAALRYATMTIACYQCHRYVKNARVTTRERER